MQFLLTRPLTGLVVAIHSIVSSKRFTDLDITSDDNNGHCDNAFYTLSDYVACGFCPQYGVHIQALYVIPRWPPNEMQLNAYRVLLLLLYYYTIVKLKR